MRSRPPTSIAQTTAVVAFVGLLAGCGPTPQERYNTALEILDREQRKLAEMEPMAEAARLNAFHRLQSETLGYNILDISAAYKEHIKGDGWLPDLVKEANAEYELGMARIREVNQNAMTIGTPEGDRIETILDATPLYPGYLKQKSRVERAKKELADAEAAL